MSKLLIGKVYKQRNKENMLPIAKSKFGDDIIGHGINRPFLIFYSDEKVYYLSTKSITDKNRELTTQDEGNLVLNQDLYGNDKEIAIDCSVINVMDRRLFESLYEKDNELNNYLTSPSIYNSVMEKLYKNLDDIQYFEVDSFDSDNTIWKRKKETIKNKDICEQIITTYNEEIKWKYRDLIYKDEDKFYSLVEEEFEEIAKQNKKTNILGDGGGLVL
ncbi:Mbov_0400 family ICE element protein [Metamycoplasma auris]|uniref:Uncharacterized protein n=1 Tax=Metamycoplasma auris TaxID=51363 RepID=A0A2W7FYI3_9BACT|nr:hypothetical protein [Metamycoplasma auris]PZV98723.1 hypothetical protein BCF89_1123 [Metamycoplasma auris]